jgi:molybdopterin-guanine dinucleotide biosynthesis protein A
MQKNVSLVIQAGGNSRRMGEDKALKFFLGQPLIQRVADRLAPIAGEILVTTNHPENYAFLGYRSIPDLIPARGALGGLYTAVASASFPIVAVVACDMPFASRALYEAEIVCLIREQVDVVVPRSQEGLEPLHAVYRSTACLPMIQAALSADRLKIIDWFSSVRVREMSLGEASVNDPAGLVFRNINTPDDFIQAEELARLSNGGTL